MMTGANSEAVLEAHRLSPGIRAILALPLEKRGVYMEDVGSTLRDMGAEITDLMERL